MLFPKGMGPGAMFTRGSQVYRSRFNNIIVPDKEIMGEESRVTHFWVIREDGCDMLYVGNPETFGVYVGEVNGVQ